jgi:Chalcone isomerase-like
MRRVMLLSLLCCAQAALALEVAGVKVDERVRLGGSELQLNGAGIRTRIIFKVYVGALYLPARKSTAADILALDGPKRVSMTMLRDLSAAQLIDALELGIRDNHTEAELAGLRERIDALAAVMKEIGGAKEKVVITLDFLPGTGTLVMLDGVPRGKPIPGEDFYRALLRIWIGEKPVDSDLKEAMLGGKN